MKDFGIRAKLILIFIVIKVIPLLIIAYIAIKEVRDIGRYFETDSQHLVNSGHDLVKETANVAIKDSIKALDKTSQDSLEKFTKQIANNVADFLYERDNDLKFLASSEIKQDMFQKFYDSKYKAITTHSEYTYDDSANKWITTETVEVGKKEKYADLRDNEKEFNHNPNKEFVKKNIPIYKEITFFDLNGKELIKVSSIDNQPKDISQKSNTYCKAETYFDKVKELNNGEIYVSDVIGAYVPTKIIGSFTKDKAQKAGIEFEPQNYGYAGIENPVGKKFEGIVRFVTPVFKNNQKIGYVSLALDHTHIMEFTDYVLPNNNMVSNISDATNGDYAFMWDYLGRNISHPRDYFITGYDPNNGNRAIPWLSKDISVKFQSSGEQDMDKYLSSYPTFEDQSLEKKPDLEQLTKDGTVGLDCRYLNFAPQCQGWMQVVKDGGYGSFIIYWSKVWKLTTAAAIPYYTGNYGNNKIGFGFVTLGASVDEFHKAANDTKNNIDTLIARQSDSMQSIIDNSKSKIENYVNIMINELTFSTLIMLVIVIVIAVWMSNYITFQISKLMYGTEKFANNELEHRIEVESNDEIGKLSMAFNSMAQSIQNLIDEQRKLNETLEDKVVERTKELDDKNHELQHSLDELKKTQDKLVEAEKMAALGGLVAGIAHEINTPIGVGVTAASHLADKTKEMNEKFSSGIMRKSDLEVFINSSIEANDLLLANLQRASELIQSFKKVAVNQTSEDMIDVELVSYTKDVLTTLSPKFKNKNYIIDVDGDSVHINTYAGDYAQIVTNLIMNSIIHGFDNQNDGRISINIKDNDDKVTILFSDNGKGISEENIPKIFDPFFTTKRGEGGSGLGLHIIFNIITNKLKGNISCASAEGVGTTFTIELAKLQ